MGFYINPENQTKEEWLIDNGQLVGFEPFNERPNGYHFVCLIDNGEFTAAAIGYCDEEVDAFNRPDDYRPKAWFLVPDHKLIAVEPSVKEVLS